MKVAFFLPIDARARLDFDLRSWIGAFSMTSPKIVAER